MYIEIITPEKRLFAGDTELVKLPGSSGSFEVLMNHAPAISTLEKGTIKVKEVNGSLLYFNIGGGLVEIKNNKVIVLVDSADLE